MKYNIGDIVKNSSNSTLIILATKDQSLNEFYINALNANLFIENIEALSKTVISVNVGFDYVVAEIFSFKENKARIDTRFQDVFEDDLER